VKVSELRKIVAGHAAADLRALVVELYKLLPKKLKEDERLDRILRHPDAIGEARAKEVPAPRSDLGALQFDLESFVSDAHAQYYVAPNRVVPKRERPKWRFKFMRFVKDLMAAAEDPDDLPEAARLLEDLYHLLCKACGQYLFNTEEPFRSIGIPQDEFLDRVLSLRQASEPPAEFVRRGLTLAVEAELDRETSHSTLLEVLLNHLKTPALREMALEECTARLKTHGDRPPGRTRRGTGGTHWRADYEWRERNQHLAEMGFRCHLALGEPEEAVEYFQRFSRWTDNPEIRLYVLLELLAEAGHRNLWVREYDRAVAAGVKPREELQRRRRSRNSSSF
jgi:hypothetical protein